MALGSPDPRMAMAAELSPRALGEAIGVSQSSLKRWADRGLLSVHRTAGGHRRIEVREALRFIRENGLRILRPELLGLPDGVDRGEEAPDAMHLLLRFLQDGDAEHARSLVLSLYGSGHPLDALFDEVFRPALEEIGTLWHDDDPHGIVVEHRATDICAQLVGELRGLIVRAAPHGVAIGGAPSGDRYILPSAMVAAVLASEGFHAINLGPELPLEVLIAAADREEARIVWISVSHAARPRTLRGEIEDLRSRLHARGGTLLVGGASHERLGLRSSPGLAVGRSISDLVVFARGIAASC